MLLCPPPRSSAGTRSTHAATRKFVEKSTLRFIQGDWIGLFNEAVERAKTAKQKLVDRATAVLENQERLADLLLQCIPYHLASSRLDTAWKPQ